MKLKNLCKVLASLTQLSKFRTKILAGYYFLGKIEFTLIIVPLAAIFALIGSLVESSSGSHLLSNIWAYHHPIFKLILFSFFLNILISALNRWPFQKKHLPFLMTHLGLLLIILAEFIKEKSAPKAYIEISEGEGVNEIAYREKIGLKIEDLNNSEWIEIIPHKKGDYQLDKFPGLKVKLTNFYANATSHNLTWIKKGFLNIFTYPLLKAEHWDKDTELPKAVQNFFSTRPNWSVLAVKTFVPELLQKKILSEFQSYPLVLFVQNLNDLSTKLIFFADYDKFFEPVIEQFIANDGFRGYEVEAQIDSLILKTNFITAFTPLAATKMEDQTPAIVAEFKLGDSLQKIALPLSNFKMKWPIFNGKMLVSFENLKEKLPYTFALHQATEVTDIAQTKIKKYKAKVALHADNRPTVHKTLVMNRGLKTFDGQTIYLSHITSPLNSNIGINRATFTVSKESHFNFFTFGGIFFLVSGAILLLYKKSRN